VLSKQKTAFLTDSQKSFNISNKAAKKEQNYSSKYKINSKLKLNILNILHSGYKSKSSLSTNEIKNTTSKKGAIQPFSSAIRYNFFSF